MNLHSHIGPKIGPRTIGDHLRIVGALMIREVATRFGREGLGFAWLVGEPLIFAFGVLLMWTLLKPAYEHGLRLAPFIMTGYMSLLLLRHMISHGLSAIIANTGLLYHRHITPLHIYISRFALEFAGTTVAFVVTYGFLLATRSVTLPHEPLLLYGGWLLLAWLSTGIALVLAAIALEHEVVERVVPVFTYLLIPISGAFTMAAWLPAKYRDLFLLVPIPHGIEMIRAGVFGEFVPTYYDASYIAAWALGLNFLGLVLLARTQRNIEVE